MLSSSALLFFSRRGAWLTEIFIGPTQFNPPRAACWQRAARIVWEWGVSMTGRRLGNGSSAPKHMRLASIKLCWRASVLLVVITVSAQAAPPNANDATSSRAAREEAIRTIPWKLMSPASRQTAQSVINNTSIYRRLPTRIIDCDPDLFTFLLQHPEIVIDVWRVMGISQVALHKSPDGNYRGTDGAGTTGTIRYLFSNWGEGAHDVAVVFADGAYQGPPFPAPLKAQSIMLVRSTAVREANGRHHITVRIDSFVRVEQLGVEIIAKTVQPWIAKTADQNLIETLTFVSNFSRTAEKNPQGMQRLANRLETLDEPTRNELVMLCFRTAERYSQRDRATRTGALFATRPDLAIIRR